MSRFVSFRVLVLLIVLAVFLFSVGSLQMRRAVEELAVSYLEEVIPPCTPISSDGPDPCPPGTPPTVRIVGAARPPLSDPLPTMTEILLVEPAYVSHMAVRGTTIPDTTRCELYPIVVPQLPPLDGLRFDDLAHYHCFVDIRVNEYYIGKGPPRAHLIDVPRLDMVGILGDVRRYH